MVVRAASRLVLLLGGLVLATALVVGALALLASTAPVEAVEGSADAGETTDSSPTPGVVLVFAGIVLLAALPPAHRVHVYHRSHHYRSDWY